jgi:hypothetical protein
MPGADSATIPALLNSDPTPAFLRLCSAFGDMSLMSCAFILPQVAMKCRTTFVDSFLNSCPVGHTSTVGGPLWGYQRGWVDRPAPLRASSQVGRRNLSAITWVEPWQLRYRGFREGTNSPHRTPASKSASISVPPPRGWLNRIVGLLGPFTL